MKTTLFFSLFIPFFGFGQPVTLDNYFAIEGIAIEQYTTEINRSVILENGNILSAGYTIPDNSGAYHLTLSQHDSNGTLVPAFGNNGIVIHEINYASQPFDIEILNDGKILIAGFVYLGPTQSGPGTLQGFVTRCFADGSIDSSFATNGTFTLTVDDSHFNDIFVLPDNSILLSGNIYNGAILYKLDENGNPDSNSGVNGMRTLSDAGFLFLNWDAVLLSDGNLLSVGLDFTNFDDTKMSCMKIDLDGNLITSFADNGRFSYDPYSGMPEVTDFFSMAKVRNDGKILLIGTSTEQKLVLIDGSGEIDESFGNAGIVSHNYPSSDVILQEDNKILIGGNVVVSDYNYGISITRLTENGDLDESFNYTGNYQLDISEENDYLQEFQFMDSTHLLVSGSSRLYDGEANFMLARLDISQTLSSEELMATDFSIYPNPAEDVLFIEGISPQKVQILNTLGELVVELPYDLESGVSLEKLSSGSYFISFGNEQERSVSILFVKH